jgi:pimeloyl-ACP methyl ester carboxylesterase
MRATAPLAPHDFAAIEARALVIYGANSDLRVRGEACLVAMPRCRIVTLPGCTHSVLWEATDRVRELLVEFVREATKGAG